MCDAQMLRTFLEIRTDGKREYIQLFLVHMLKQYQDPIKKSKLHGSNNITFININSSCVSQNGVMIPLKLQFVPLIPFDFVVSKSLQSKKRRKADRQHQSLCSRIEEIRICYNGLQCSGKMQGTNTSSTVKDNETYYIALENCKANITTQDEDIDSSSENNDARQRTGME